MRVCRSVTVSPTEGWSPAEGFKKKLVNLLSDTCCFKKNCAPLKLLPKPENDHQANPSFKHFMNILFPNAAHQTVFIHMLRHNTPSTRGPPRAFSL